MSSLNRDTRTIRDDKFWVVSGKAGAASWCLQGDTVYEQISIHTPVSAGGERTCLFLAGRCRVTSLREEGEDLGKAWEASGRNVEVIWDALTKVYREKLANLTRARS